MDRIVEVLKNKCCIFVGAGIPKNLGFPLWSELACHLVQVLWNIRDDLKKEKFDQNIQKELEEEINKGNCIRAITYCETLLKENELRDVFIKEIVTIFGDDSKCVAIKNNPIYIELFKFVENSFFIQTNIDQSIELFKDIQCFLNDSLPQDTYSQQLPFLVYLHGIVTRPETWIFTRKEYVDSYQKNSGLSSFLQSVFKNYNVIFLGYSLSDREILDNLAKGADNGKKYYLVMEEIERDKWKNKIWETDLNNYGISVVKYDVSNEESSEAFLKFLKKINSFHIPKIDTKKPKESDRKKIQ